MGVFLRVNNADRFPGLVIRVKGDGDEIEIDYEGQRGVVCGTNTSEEMAATSSESLDETAL